jgi:translation initiation factor 2D
VLHFAEIDEAFVKAFLYSLYKLKQDNPTTPDHGISFPIQPSVLISNFVTPYLPIHSPKHAQYYQIKKTSWKNVKKFIKHLDKEVLVRSKDRNGQETVILDVDFSDNRVEQFVPYRLPSKNAVENSGKPVSKKTKAAEDGDDPSIGQSLTVHLLYRPTSKLTPTMFPSDSKSFYKQSDVSNHVDNYLTSRDPPLVSEQNKRIVKLDPFLANTIFSSSSADDRATLSRGEVTRDGLLKRSLHDPSLCASFHAILLKPGQKVADVKPKAGPPPKVTTVLERRTGNKTVTKVSGIEIFGVVPTLLAEELQKKCASSTSVTQASGAVKGVMEILIQGDQRQAVETALGKRGIKSQWIDVVDKTKKKK